MQQWHEAKNLAREYNGLDSNDNENKQRILNEILGGRGEHLWITAPFFVDYGNSIYFGNNCEINMNCTFLDDNKIVIGDNVWIGGGSIILSGVTIGDNVTIGAGSVVTKSIPSNTVAYGNPCRVVRENN